MVSQKDFLLHVRDSYCASSVHYGRHCGTSAVRTESKHTEVGDNGVRELSAGANATSAPMSPIHGSRESKMELSVRDMGRAVRLVRLVIDIMGIAEERLSAAAAWR